MDYRKLRRRYVAAHKADIGEVLRDQADVVRSVYQQSDRTLSAAAVFDSATWNRRLADRLFVRNRITAVDFGLAVAGGDRRRSAPAKKPSVPQFDPSELDPFLLKDAGMGAEGINGRTFDEVQDALTDDDPDGALERVFGVLLGSSLDRYAASTVTMSANFGMTVAADQVGLGSKTWTVNSSNPRSSHAAVDGETVKLGELFSNGMSHPGDPSGGADEVANCECSVSFGE